MACGEKFIIREILTRKRFEQFVLYELFPAALRVLFHSSCRRSFIMQLRFTSEELSFQKFRYTTLNSSVFIYNCEIMQIFK